MIACASDVPGHYRHSSELSFAGFGPCTEARRGFEFHDNRPNFYPPPGAISCAQRGKHEFMFSIASILSYGQVINDGSMVPFDCGVAPFRSLRNRPSLDELSFSMSSIDDTLPSADNLVARTTHCHDEFSCLQVRSSEKNHLTSIPMMNGRKDGRPIYPASNASVGCVGCRKGRHTDHDL
ncbi:hypothetical protein K503DRAFT_295848 [Rhizopogon vinicolor AM-OR11-026]|uniref:Uncharacterized protein n=1 Tax=Rhizopogon vinicolor AM-OR11-026 TaxID=1314800 RepID=A0A1B7MV40_9AGAM|nr:hypothetical protein K503DRAFT_295848 [Rhizopogon vinicolor AM-OR11-026]